MEGLAAKQLDKNILRAKLDKALEELQTQIANFNGRYFVISGEGLCLSSRENLEFLADLLRSTFDEIKIICYVRNPFDYARSVAQEVIKDGRTIEDLLENTFNRQSETASCLPNYEAKMINFVNVFGRDNVLIRNYSGSLYKDSVVNDFMYVNFNISELAEEEIIRNSSSDHVLLMSYNARNKALRKSELQDEITFLLDAPLDETYDDLKRPFELVNFDFTAFQKLIRKDVEWLAHITNEAIDFRNVPVPELKSDQNNYSYVGVVMQELSDSYYTINVKANLYRGLLLLSQGKKNIESFMENAIINCTDVKLLLNVVAHLKNMDHPAILELSYNRIKELSIRNRDVQRANQMNAWLDKLKTEVA